MKRRSPSGRSPIEGLGTQDFIERYGELFSQRAQITAFEQSIIDGKAQALWIADLSERDGEHEFRAVRAALFVLDQAAEKKHTRNVIVKVASALDRVGYALNDVFADRPRKRSTAFTTKESTENWLDAYTTCYESLVRLIYTPIVYAYRLNNPNVSEVFRIGSDDLARLSALKELEDRTAYPFELFKYGLHAAYRNARAHRHYEIFEDEDYFEYWDATTPRTRTHVSELATTCDHLLINANCILDALLIWFINHRKVAFKRGWIKEKRRIKLSLANYRNTITKIADDLSFDLDKFSRDEETETESFTLCIRRKGISQTSQIYRASKTWTESYDVETSYEECPIIEQVVGFLQRMCFYSPPPWWDIKIVHYEDDTPLGRLKTRSGVVRQITPQKKMRQIRKGFEQETIGDATMFVKFESHPKRATPKLSIKPKNE